jgi:DNA-binding MarR family transcriptional regulator
MQPEPSKQDAPAWREQTDKILAYAKEHGPVNARTVAEALGIKLQTVSSQLSRLHACERLTRRGKHGSYEYGIPGNPPPADPSMGATAKVLAYLEACGAPANLKQIAEGVRLDRRYVSTTLRRLYRQGRVLAEGRVRETKFSLGKIPDATQGRSRKTGDIQAAITILERKRDALTEAIATLRRA